MPGLPASDRTVARVAMACTLGIAAVLAGCASTPSDPAASRTPSLPGTSMQSTFDPAVHERYRGAGTALVNGQAFLRDGGTSLVTCEGTRVTLLPATPFFREAVDTMVQGRRPVAVDRIDPSFRSVMRDAACDAAGGFRFANVPAGRWLLLTKIQWDAGAGATRGGWLVREITVGDGQSLGVRLTDADLRSRR